MNICYFLTSTNVPTKSIIRREYGPFNSLNKVRFTTRFEILPGIAKCIIGRFLNLGGNCVIQNSKLSDSVDDLYCAPITSMVALSLLPYINDMVLCWVKNNAFKFATARAQF